MTYEDNEIVRLCQSGQMDKFGLLYDKYIRRIYDFIYYKTTHKETAEDLTSLAFMKALEKIGSFNLEKGTFSAWLYQIARNTVIDHYRTKKSAQNIEDIYDLAGDENIDRDLDTKLKLEKIEKYLALLKPEQRDLIIMRVWQEMSYNEIACALGKSEDACKVAFSRAISKLRMEMPTALFLYLLFNHINNF
jgi:RNA polymerase sigma-70 factor (ECF subfamily)